ncbi:MAG: hypothetical protein N2114_02210, partial [Candidatus Goldbacteria bacterium]|nr:hypothetical protein [Candidatus Goldiibacteriota bacterium]
TVSNTYTPTPEPTKEEFSVDEILVYPNPFKPTPWRELSIRFISTQNCVQVTMLIFTTSFRKVKEINIVENFAAGVYNTVKIESKMFKYMANGIYYYYLIFKSQGGEKLRTRAEELVILK